MNTANSAPTTPAPETLVPARAGSLGIGAPRVPSCLGAYDALVESHDPRDPACRSNSRVPQSLCGDCLNRSSVAVVDYCNETIGACGKCLPGLVANGAQVIA